MKNKMLACCLVFFASGILYGQQINAVKRTPQESIIYEKEQSGELIDTISDYGILIAPITDNQTLSKTNVLLFKRIKDSFKPQLHVWYHFDQDFKTIKGIRYHWGLYNPSFNPKKQAKVLEELSTQEKAFKRKYNELEKELIAEFGKPIKSKIIADTEDKLIQNVFWETSDRIIMLSMKFTRKLRDTGYGLDGDYKIEVMTTFK